MRGRSVVGDKPESLETTVKTAEKLYPFLVDDAGNRTGRKDVRNVQVMLGKGLLLNEWMAVKGHTMGVQYGVGHEIGNAKHPGLKGNVATVFQVSAPAARQHSPALSFTVVVAHS